MTASQSVVIRIIAIIQQQYLGTARRTLRTLAAQEASRLQQKLSLWLQLFSANWRQNESFLWTSHNLLIWHDLLLVKFSVIREQALSKFCDA